jgi:hypothetical protein
VHTSTFRWRGEDTEVQNWTPAHVPGPRYLTHPVYLLLSSQTASAAEEFAYALRQLDRVKLVGETTAGAAYGTLIARVDAHLDFTVSNGYPVHPKTGTNWWCCARSWRAGGRVRMDSRMRRCAGVSCEVVSMPDTVAPVAIGRARSRTGTDSGLQKNSHAVLTRA